MFQTKLLLLVGLIAILNLTNNIQQVQCQKEENKEKRKQVKGEAKKQWQAYQNKIYRPTFTWPNQFEITLSTNEFALNITEIVYFDKLNKKLRIQLFYSVLGLDASKGFDLIFDEQNQTVAVQTDEECKRTDFKEGLIPVNMFFALFNQLTDYEGHNDDFLHVFKVKSFNDDLDSIQFRFFFDPDMNYVKSSVTQTTLGELGLGDFQVDVVEPLKERAFTDKDWYLNDCEQIDSGILASGNGWVGFMHQLVSHLFMNGDDIHTYLGWNNLNPSTDDDEDEDFEY